MRPSLLHPLSDKRHPGRRRGGRLAALAQRRASATHAPMSVESATTIVNSPSEGGVDLTYDIAAQRVREAGGPIDEASYSCACGLVFAASVSTSVCCPHCGATQAW
jgi:hypothetical protein